MEINDIFLYVAVLLAPPFFASVLVTFIKFALYSDERPHQKKVHTTTKKWSYE